MKNGNQSIYKQMQRLADLTTTMVLKGKLTRAKRALDAAERLFISGNYQSRNAVVNVFVYNLSAILTLHQYNLHTLLPRSLQKEYVKQINAF